VTPLYDPLAEREQQARVERRPSWPMSAMVFVAGVVAILIAVLVALNVAGSVSKPQKTSGQTPTPMQARSSTSVRSGPVPLPATTWIPPNVFAFRAEDGIYVLAYTVKPGDTLTSIAQEFHTRPDLLYIWQADHIGPNPDLIHPGDYIIVALAPSWWGKVAS
jgi:LysM repeat protein